jgi:putative radical SAM enzyme (TIGR03279 family)
MLKITSVEKGSPAEKNGIMKGDYVLSVNGRQIDDALDFSYHTAQDDLIVETAGESGPGIVKFLTPGDNGISVEDIKIRHCGNNCVFCFINQNPKGMRKTIYVKDEDYRFSFLYGNYFTLTGITRKELDKIAEMKLSPLYVSVHAVNDEARKKLLGTKKDDKLLEKMRFLISVGIELHTQIVLCPGINDGETLKETIAVLGSFHPGVKTLAVVPVGLTKHREKLPKLEPVTKKIAAETIKIISAFNKKFKIETGTYFVFAADEFYLKAELDFPDEEYYENYLQYEDGVGMARNFIERFKETVCDTPCSVQKKTRIVIVTGELFYPVMESLVLKEFRKVKNLETEIVRAENNLFGRTVTVAGLLSGSDIALSAGKAKSKNDILLIPSTCLNTDGKFLDDMTVSELSQKTGFKVLQFENPTEVFENF